MTSSLTQSRYSRVAIWLHWIIAVLIIGQLVGGKVMTWMDPTSLKFELYQYHKSFGIMILLLSFIRLFWRFGHKPPALPETMKPWERRLAGLSHKAFYALMIGIPLSGWAMVSASTFGIKTKLFKIVPWPHIPGVPQSTDLENILKSVHEWMGVFIFVLLALHIGAALKHHYKDKDNVLSRMVPWVKSKSRTSK